MTKKEGGSNDLYFVESQGIPTPNTFYKVVVKHYFFLFKDTSCEDLDVIAWIMKNSIEDRAD